MARPSAQTVHAAYVARMVWTILALLLVLLLAAWPVRNALQSRREVRLESAEAFRTGRKAMSEDVTVFGEELAELHVDTLTTELEGPVLEDYQRALDAYERSKRLLRDATSVADITELSSVLADGRFARSCVLARRDGEELPHRREQCFFNPQHGPAATDVTWTPQGGVERQVPVCRADANRLANGQLPLVRIVATAGGLVPWYVAGPWVHGAPGATRAHVSGGHTWHTDKHIAEAHLRRSFDANPFDGGGMGGI
jgi:hypothetical protein